MSEAYRAAQASQRLAADPAQSVFVTANAGSGKTKVLVDRIARLLLAGAAPSSFLCITFTKAAAAEMQRRLFERLGDWCVANDETLTKELLELGEAEPDAERLALARALFARALETPGGLRIQTIHGFCERLVARFPLEAGVAPGFEIAEETRGAALIELAWARVVADADRDVDAALDRFGARLDALAFDALVAALAARRGDLGGFIAGALDRGRAAIRLRHGADATPEEITAAALTAVDWAKLIAMQDVLEASGGNDAKTAARIAAAREAPSLDALLAIFLKSDGERYAKFCKDAVMTNHAALVSACDEIATALLAAREGINAAERAADAGAALTIGHALGAAYAAVKDEAGALDFEDLIERASALLNAAESAPWVLYKLDGGLTHILIDEGQDTSPAQWRLIAPLQAEFFAGEGARGQDRTVFAVGDPKQSIYSFQGADPAHFLKEAQALDKRATGAGRAFVAPTLAMSFRSAPEVLRAVDATFETLALGDDASEGDVMAHAAYRDAEIGRVEWWPLAPRPTQVPARPWDAPMDTDTDSTSIAVLCNALATRVQGWIDGGEAVWEKRQKRAMRPGDVLALVRVRGPLFKQVLRSMKRVGLPVAGADRMTLADEIAVQDILAAARVALDPTDDLALATLLKSPWIGLIDDDADIFPLAHGRAEGEHVIDRLRAAGDARFAPARAFVDGLIANAGAHPHAFVSAILERADGGVSGWERMLARLGIEARDPAEELLSRALQCGRKGPATLQHFVHAVESDAVQIKRETDQTEDAVRVMTVHGAKGLEAPVVLLADTSGGVKSDPAGNLYITPDGPVLRGGRNSDDAVVTAAREAAAAAAELENRRLLYVAMTRAKDRLIVCGHARGNPKSGAEAGAWWGLVREGMERAGATACATPFGDGLALGKTFVAETKVAKLKSASAQPPDWARRAAPAEGPAPEAVAPSRLAQGPVLSPRGAARARFRRGTLIHGLLQRLPDVPARRRAKAAAAWLAARGVSAEDADAYAAEARRVLDDPRFAPLFGPGSRAEAPIIATLADGVVVRGAIDRIVVTDTTVLALDYKTDRPPPERVEDTPPRILAQMAAYRAALALIFPGRTVETVILWTDGPRLMALPPALLDAIRPADARC